MSLSKKFGRRAGMRGATLLAVIALLTAVSIPNALAARHAGAPARAKAGGTLLYRDTGTPTCVDPLKAPTTVEGVVDYATFDNLVLLDGKGNVRPDLATSWSYSHGGKWITFKLRHGVRFSNGDPVTASVIKYNLDRVLGPVGQQAGMSSFLGPLHKVVVNNKYSVTLITTSPFRPIMPNLANDSLGIIDPAALAKEG